MIMVYVPSLAIARSINLSSSALSSTARFAECLKLPRTFTIVRGDMAVNIKSSAFAAQSVAFISVEVEEAAGALRNPQMCEPRSSREWPFSPQCHLLMESKTPSKLVDH